MKKITLAVFLVLCVGSCLADYSPNYSSYWSTVFDDVNTGNLVQTLVLDGTTDGDCWLNGGTYYIPNCPAWHQPGIENYLNNVSSGQYYGGGDMFSYISITDTVTISNFTDGEEFQSQIEATVYCNVASANIFDTGFLNRFFETAFSRANYAGTYGNCRVVAGVQVCDYLVNLWCTDATTPPDLFDVSPITDSEAVATTPPKPPPNGTSPLFWDVHSLCVRLPPFPYICSGVPSPIFGHPYAGVATKAQLPKAACTCKNKGGSGC